MAEYFRITWLCDISKQSAAFCASKIPGSSTRLTDSATELCSSDEVDAVMVCSAPVVHAEHTILALKNNKSVFVEKPLAVTFRDVDAMQAAEKESLGSVFVGFNRRFAPSFRDAVEEVKNAGPVTYARVRDIIAPNEYFIGQCGFAYRKYMDIPEVRAEEFARAESEMNEIALHQEYGVPVTNDTKFLLMILSGLGSHDFSAMRQVLGMPLSVRGALLKHPIFTATFEYENFAVVYESGLNDVPVFDCHLEVYTDSKIVRVNYDSPFIKGLPVTMTIREKAQDPNGEDYYQQREIRSTYVDTYTLEHKSWYECLVKGIKPDNGLEDARQDLEIYKMVLRAGFAQSDA